MHKLHTAPANILKYRSHCSDNSMNSIRSRIIIMITLYFRSFLWYDCPNGKFFSKSKQKKNNIQSPGKCDKTFETLSAVQRLISAWMFFFLIILCYQWMYSSNLTTFSLALKYNSTISAFSNVSNMLNQ